jgi:hypothetical protein
MTFKQKNVLDQLNEVYEIIWSAVNPARQLCVHIYDANMKILHFAYYCSNGKLIKAY